MFGRVDQQVESLKEELYKVQEAKSIDMNNDMLVDREKELSLEYIKALKIEEIFFFLVSNYM